MKSLKSLEKCKPYTRNRPLKDIGMKVNVKGQIVQFLQEDDGLDLSPILAKYNDCIVYSGRNEIEDLLNMEDYVPVFFETEAYSSFNFMN